MNKVLRVVAVLTCFNRKEKTIACVKGLKNAADFVGDTISLGIIVADDNSRDGTSTALAEQFPDVEILHGNGSMFWNGGMHKAFGKAIADGYDYYLWINDDIEVYENFLGEMLSVQNEIHAETGQFGIVVGSTCNQHHQLSYGGLRLVLGRKTMKTALVQPENKSVQIDTFNGNCVLIAQGVVDILGNIDPVFRHKMGDIDYGLRAKQQGIQMRIAKGYLAECEHDHKIEGSYLDVKQPFKQRWKNITSPKELPIEAWFTFCKRHAGFFWPVYWMWPYFKVLITSLRAG